MVHYLNFKLAVRNIIRHRLYSILNIVGLSIGLTLVLYIGLYLNDQFSYDKWYTDHDRIYRVEFNDWAILGPVYASLIEPSSGNIEKVIRVNSGWGHEQKVKTQYNEIFFKIPYLVMADPDILDFFPFKFIEGSWLNALQNTSSIIISKSQAIKLYGRTDILGEVLRVQDKYLLTITGVFEDVKHFHFRVDAIAPFELFAEIFSPDYLKATGEWNHNTYVKLHKDSNVDQTAEAIKNYVEYILDKNYGIKVDRKVNLRPVADIYFAEKLHEILIVHGDKNLTFSFLIIAVFILLIAVINFVNLATARSARRAKETGIKKLLGSTRAELIKDYLWESLFVTILAVVIAFAQVEIFLPWFNYIAGSESSLADIGFWKLGLMFVSGIILVSMISGAYPAFYLSAFQPAKTLKGEMVRGKGASYFRKCLIIFQFTISVSLIAGTIIVYQQLKYMQQKDMGFDKEGLIHFPMNARVYRGWEEFRNTLQAHPDIQSVALSNTIPGHVRWQESLVNDGKTFLFTYWPMDPDYFELLGLHLIEGRAFSRDFLSDLNQAVVINEQWIKNSGISYEKYEDFIGQMISNKYRIVGITRDFQYNSLHEAVAPLMMAWRDNSLRIVTVKINHSESPHVIHHIEETWKAISPDEIFSYSYLSDSMDKLYEGEKKMGVIFLSFSSFAVLIACMGLFGLASFMIEKRIREISIRKILGASSVNLMLLLSKEFLALIIVSMVIAIPLCTIAMQNWLNSYSERIVISSTPFLMAISAALLLTVATMGYHVIRLSHHNPSETLNSE
jgi:putative ABC transport system permease protein